LTKRHALHRFDNAKRRRPESHDRQRQLTPAYLLEPVRELLGGEIGLDPCTEPDNPTRALRFYCPPVDGCVESWEADSVFCNPPYGQVRLRWVKRCIEVGARIPTLLLIPAHTETQTFQLAARACTSALFVQARLRFGVKRDNGRQEAASHGSVLFGYGVDLSPLAQLGVVFRAQEESQPF